MDGPSLAREYYRTIDEDDYEALAGILAAEFVQYRPDRTLSGRDRFVRFMREERPEPDTEHDVRTVYVAAEAPDGEPEGGPGSDRVAAEGQLRRADGSVWFDFVDTFEVADGRLASLRTYTNGG